MMVIISSVRAVDKTGYTWQFLINVNITLLMMIMYDADLVCCRSSSLPSCLFACFGTLLYCLYVRRVQDILSIFLIISFFSSSLVLFLS